MTLDHIGFNVNDFPAFKAFLLQALQPLGIGVVSEGDGWAMIGKAGKGQFWFGGFGNAPGPIHIAFAADNRAPGLRPQYHPNYYGAFAISPDGHNIEAVCHAPGA